MPEGPGLGSQPEQWDGRTYYGRSQLKQAPFNNFLVGTYVFLAGLSGGAQLLATVIDLARGRAAEPAIRRGRYLPCWPRFWEVPASSSICTRRDASTTCCGSSSRPHRCRLVHGYWSHSAALAP